MRNSHRNAAIWYAQDGYDASFKGINGRRVAGESFLKGFLLHADVDEFVFLAKQSGELDPVRANAAQIRPDVPVRCCSLLRPDQIAPVGTVYFPSPNFASEAWRRAPHGTAAWSICGITHTTSTAAVMQGFFDLRMAPVFAWDAVICTSKSVLDAVNYQMDLIDSHIRQHLGVNPPQRPMLPVIPLGIHTNDFAPDPAKGKALRDKLGAAENDVVFVTIARLTPHEKFDPLPVYIAMQNASRALQGQQKLFVVMCGRFKDDYSRQVFEQGAARLMPDVGFVILDGADAAERKAALSAADVFLFMIDNIQETFGLAPIEGMAAGLALLVSDWDGMRDTVTPDVGFRITSRSLGPQHLTQEALRYQGGLDNYVQYCAATSALTEIDMPEFTARILQLATNPDLRKKMGRAAALRARAVYDWRHVLPQMQDLWQEQDLRRRLAIPTARRYRADALPIAPSPTALFAGYPTEKTSFADTTVFANDLSGRATVNEVLELRNYQGLKRIFASPEQIITVFASVQAAGDTGAQLSFIEASSGIKGIAAERILIWLMKYDFIRRG